MSSLFKTLLNASNEAVALTKVAIGQAIDGAVNGIGVFGFRNSSGQATMPQLNDEGALPVTLDPGTTINIPMVKKTQAEMETAGLNVRVELGTVSLLPDRKYTKPAMKVVANRAMLFELVMIQDAGGVGEAETILDATYLEAGQTSFVSALPQEFFQTDANVDTKNLVLYATMKDNKASDVYGKASANLVAAN